MSGRIILVLDLGATGSAFRYKKGWQANCVQYCHPVALRDELHSRRLKVSDRFAFSVYGRVPIASSTNSFPFRVTRAARANATVSADKCNGRLMVRIESQ